MTDPTPSLPEAMKQETWKPIVRYEGLYEVSSLGRIRSLERMVYGRNKTLRKIKGKIIIAALGNRGYQAITLSKDGKQYNHRVHRLVAEAFVLKTQSNHVVNHKDGNRLNNDAENLEWCTSSENTLHAFKIGRMKGGANARHAKLTDEKVRLIRKRLISEPVSSIAREFNVRTNTVYLIKANRTWKHPEAQIDL